MNRPASNAEKLAHIYDLAAQLLNWEYDEEEQRFLARSILHATGICPHCNGQRVTGEPPDAAGVGGYIGACDLCNGKGVVAVWVDETGEIVE